MNQQAVGRERALYEVSSDNEDSVSSGSFAKPLLPRPSRRAKKALVVVVSSDRSRSVSPALSSGRSRSVSAVVASSRGRGRGHASNAPGKHSLPAIAPSFASVTRKK